MKSISKAWPLAAGMLFSFMFFFNSCQKDVVGDENIPAGSNKFSVYLTDGPADYQNVFIDIQSIAVKIDTCHRNHDDDYNYPGCDDDHDRMNSRCEIWDTIAIRPGVYDLMSLRNGVDTLLASAFVLNGKVERIKFTLGTNNSVVTADSVKHPLQLLNSQNFVFVDIRRDHLDSVSSNNFQLFLDFNLDRSIWYAGGKYWLKPYLKPFGRHSTGQIEGKIKPSRGAILVKAFNATDTAYAIPWHEGEFKIRGLKEGTYSVFIDGYNGYKDTTINNVSVTRNRDTKLNTIQLHQ